MNDNYLIHYGVKGMKWGVRKDPRNAVRSARSTFAKGVGQTYKVNEAIEKRKEKAWGKVNKVPIVSIYSKKKQKTAKENRRYYEQTRKDLTSGKVAPARTKYQKFIRAVFFKNPIGRAWTLDAIKNSDKIPLAKKYKPNMQTKVTALAEFGLIENYYAEQKKLKKQGKAYNKY